MLPAERQQYLEDLGDAIEGLVKGATILERVVVRLVTCIPSGSWSRRFLLDSPTLVGYCKHAAQSCGRA
jgi:hypothetical protein